MGEGGLTLSPADDILLRIERALDIDSVGLMIASVLSKKVAAGSTDVLIDMPVGVTAKVRTTGEAERISSLFVRIGSQMGLNIRVHQSDGSQPVGRGIGPALEARDILAVLMCDDNAPDDLKSRAVDLAGNLLEMSGRVPIERGREEALKALESGNALKKFYSICEAQGGFRKPSLAKYQKTIVSDTNGIVTAINNRKIAMLAKLAGAPRSPRSGVDFLSPTGSHIEQGTLLYVLHSDSEGQLQYALDYVADNKDILTIEEK